MNQLSWLLYWADTLPSLASTMAFVFFFFSGAALVGLFLHFVSKMDSSDNYEGELKFMTWLAPLMILIFISCNLIPSKETFYLIAASEMGKNVTETPEFTKMRKVINKVLDDQLQEPSDNATGN